MCSCVPEARSRRPRAQDAEPMQQEEADAVAALLAAASGHDVAMADGEPDGSAEAAEAPAGARRGRRRLWALRQCIDEPLHLPSRCLFAAAWQPTVARCMRAGAMRHQQAR